MKYPVYIFIFIQLVSITAPSGASVPISFFQSQQIEGDTAQYSSQDTTKQDTIVQNIDTLVSKSALESEVTYNSQDSIVYDLGDKKVHMYGGAKVTYEDLKLEAAYIRLDYTTNTVYAEGVEDSTGELTGTPVFFEKDQEFKAKRMAYNFDTKKGKLYNIITKEGEGHIHGEEVKKDPYDVIYASKAKYTTCDLEDPHFYISANKIKIIPNDKIISGPAYLVIEGIPLPAILPFGFFPHNQKQASGFVIPAYGESPRRGFYLENGGYYFGINDNLDMMLTGSIYSRGSWMLSNITRYAKRYRFNGEVQLQYGKNIFGEPESPDYEVFQDYTIKWMHNQAPKARPNSSFRADVDIASKSSYRNNSRNASEIVQNNLASSINYSTDFRNTPFRLSTSARHSQNLTSGVVDLTLPQATFTVNRQTPFSRAETDALKRLNFNYNINFKNQLKTSDSLLFEPETWEDFRNGFSHSLPISTSVNLFNYLTLNPYLRYNGTFSFDRIRRQYVSTYAQGISQATGNDTLIYVDDIIEHEEQGFFATHEYNTGTDLSTRLYGMFNINSFGIVAIRHMMIPTINFNYRPDFSEGQYGYYDEVQVDSLGNRERYSLYRNNIFSGPGRGEQASIGVRINNNFEMKVRTKNDTASSTKKVKLLESFNIQGNYNFAADSFKLSNISINAFTNVLDLFTINGNATINPYVYSKLDTAFVDKVALIEDFSLGQLTNARLNISTSLNPEMFNREEEERVPEFYQYVSSPYYYYYMDFNLPWNLTLGYNINYNRSFTGTNLEPRITQAIDARGDIKLTDKWRIGGSTGYDFEAKDFTFSSIDIYRDLHCWEMSFKWFPIGSRSRYMFQINVKSQVLQDLQLKKKQEPWDR